MLVCIGCGRTIAHVNDNVKYDLCGTCLFIETEFIPPGELISPTTELTVVG